ncbi:KEOPS complex subunit [Candidatus Bathyarchaeota archaeon]|nr:KEOPS complex subunit [Candidatus Bathyarchaeota archaeon]
MEAEIVLEYDNMKIGEAVAKAVSPDNFKTPKGLTIETTWKDGKVLTTIRCKKGLPTFIATIDDFLFCTLTAEKTLQTAKRLK